MKTYIEQNARGSARAMAALRAASQMVVALLTCILPAFAQEIAPRVIAEQGLRFALIERSETITVSPENDSAALFAIWGEPQQEVILGVTIVDPVGRDEHSMAIELDQESCTASTDGGITWRNVDLVTGACTLRFGEAAAGFDEAVIFVRIGGAIASSDTQRRGDYSGGLTLSANYAPGRIRVGIPATARRAPGPAVEPRPRSEPTAAPRREPGTPWTRIAR